MARTLKDPEFHKWLRTHYSKELKDLRKYKEVTKPLLEKHGVKKEIAASNNLLIGLPM